MVLLQLVYVVFRTLYFSIRFRQIVFVFTLLAMVESMDIAHAMQRQMLPSRKSTTTGSSGDNNDDEDNKKVLEIFKRLREREAKRKQKSQKPEKEAEEEEIVSKSQGEGSGKGGVSDTTTTTTVTAQQVAPDRDNSGVSLGSVNVQGQEYEVYGTYVPSPYSGLSAQAHQIVLNLQNNNHNSLTEGIAELAEMAKLSEEQVNAINEYNHGASRLQEMVSSLMEGLNNVSVVSPLRTAMTMAVAGGIGFVTLYFVKKTTEYSGGSGASPAANTLVSTSFKGFLARVAKFIYEELSKK